MPDTLTISAAARLCRCDRRTLQRAIHTGRLHLDAQHCLSREELIATGYLIADAPQETPQDTPWGTPQDVPQLGTATGTAGAPDTSGRGRIAGNALPPGEHETDTAAYATGSTTASTTG